VVSARLRARGFTLVEMLVVLAIVALLLSIALPRYFASLDEAREVALRENLRVLRQAIDRYAADRGGYPQNLDELVVQKYLKAVPVDPMTDSAATWQLVPSPEGADKGIVDVHSGAHGAGRDGLSYESL